MELYHVEIDNWKYAKVEVPIQNRNPKKNKQSQTTKSIKKVNL